MAKFTAVLKEVSFIQVEVEADTLEEAEEMIEHGEFDLIGPHGDETETELVEFIENEG